MHRQIRRLVHQQQRFILIYHAQGQLHPLDAHAVLRQNQLYPLPRRHPVNGPKGHAVGGDPPRHLLELHHHPPGKAAAPAQESLDGGAVVFRRNGKGEARHRVSSLQWKCFITGPADGLLFTNRMRRRSRRHERARKEADTGGRLKTRGTASPLHHLPPPVNGRNPSAVGL